MTSLLHLDEQSVRSLRTAGETGQPQEVTHALRSHALLTLEALADLAVSLPADSIEHNVGALPDVVADGRAPRLEVGPEGLREMILGLETNGAWCVVKNVEQDPAYSALLDSCLDEIEDLVSGPGQAYKREGFVFLSAPGSMTPSHIDPEHNVLLQVQGTKTMVTGSWATPDARAAEAERLVGGGHRNLQHDIEDPVEHHLEPGDGIYVPPYTQHKVVNGPALSISLSVTWRSRALADEVKVLRANTHLRRAGLSPAAPGTRPAVDRTKATAMSVAEKAKAAVRRSR
ncbi:Cupin superfamily protein [Nocardioides dokdonensis FR1436]|uniref:Cupin superfamily protein n=1 Tax=Nocardioides dokdonensis FR1436 TaxID=1300347 RepID=A0A1A9GNN3_9ACTN|nr:cupin domain-containing protein [Nocardioides dokdonensis]ANH39203.1 Cupin superfamily protein [Nocardioides dokdonensis FR1436]